MANEKKENSDRLVLLLAEQARFLAEIEYCQPFVSRHANALEAYHKASREVVTLLDTMDLEAQGNSGFGGRMCWFLREMRKALLKSGV